MNFPELLGKQAVKNPDKTAVVFRSSSVTFKQLSDYVSRLANSLIDLGIKKGDRVAVYLPNCPEYIYSYLAIWAAGACAVPLDFMLTQDELVSCISHSEARILIAKQKANSAFDTFADKCPGLNKIIICQTRENPGQAKGQLLSFEELLKSAKDNLPQVKTEDKEYAIIFYTSGTTGKPKGVLINYRQLEASPKAMKYFVDDDVKDGDLTLCSLPFSHLAGLIYIQANIVFGATIVLMERFSPLDFLKDIQKYRISWFWLVPSMYYAFLQLKEFETFDLSSLRWLVIFGAPSSPEAMRRFHKHCPQAHLFHGWGLTETNAPTTVIPTGSAKIESVGRPAPWIEVKIFDDTDQEAGQGQVGEIAVRGWVVTEDYYKDPALTAQTMRSGWFHTGDLGRIDSQGYLYIVGRKKEMIKVSGEIVFEPEVESVIYKHPDVAEAAVIGVADKLRGEVPKAFIVPKEGRSLSEEVLRDFCRQHLAHFKIPRYFEFINSLPKNRTGKIDKEKLRPSA
ncbi:MAG: AMP-binding protein [Candidatus Omnitrophica bacterium]|nr:AMP-binding protein [Candidatus Omnitrophota bacterium]